MQSQAPAPAPGKLITRFLAVSGTALLVVFISFLLDWNLYRTQQALARNYAQDVILAQELRALLHSEEALERSYLLRREARVREQLLTIESEIDDAISSLSKWHASPEEPILMDRIASAEARYRRAWAAMLSKTPVLRSPAADLARSVQAARDERLSAAADLVDLKRGDLRDAARRAGTTGYISVLLSGGLAVGLLLVTILTGAFVRRALIDIEKERKTLEEEKADLERLVSLRTRRLEAMLEHLRAFGYSVAHDLRRPARSIAAFSEIVLKKEGGLDEETRSHLRRIHDAARRLRMMLDGLLTLSRLSQERAGRQAVDLAEVARGILDELAALEPGRRAAVNVPQRLIVEGDRKLLQVLMQNLLENAWKFTAKAREARIDVGSETRHGETVLFVRDNGVGFDPAFAQQLFKPFHRLPSADDFPGLGIGLASAARVIEAHGGRIWAESILGQGAGFFFTLGRAA